MLRATTVRTHSTSQLPKVLRAWCALYILTWKCASPHNGVHFFNISTSKSAPTLRCFVHFDLQMCFAPQRRATFHLSSILIWPHVSAPAALASLLCDPPEPQIIGKTWENKVNRDFSTFRAPASSFLWLFLFSDLFSSSLLFSDSSHLWFSSVNMIGSLTSKLPSMICSYSCMSLLMMMLGVMIWTMTIAMAMSMAMQACKSCHSLVIEDSTFVPSSTNSNLSCLRNWEWVRWHSYRQDIKTHNIWSILDDIGCTNVCWFVQTYLHHITVLQGASSEPSKEEHTGRISTSLCSKRLEGIALPPLPLVLQEIGHALPWLFLDRT